jgi:hypothetical protein
MQRDISIAIESAEMCDTFLSACQKALNVQLHSLSRFSHAAAVSNRPQVMVALEAHQLMLEIEALEEAWTKACKSANRAGEVSFKLADLVQALRKENASLQVQVQYSKVCFADGGLLWSIRVRGVLRIYRLKFSTDCDWN